MKKTILILVVLFVAVIILIGIFIYTNKDKFTALTETNIETVGNNTTNPASLNWEQITGEASWPKRDSHGFVVYKNKIWLMGGVDGTTRMIAPGNVDYGNAPHFRDVWSSSDGINWQQNAKNALWGDRRSMQVVNFKGKMWLMGGWGPELSSKNDVWSSEDGAKWKLESASANWSPREGHQVLVFKNKLWLIGGVRYDRHKVFNDVWYSEDGINWIEATKNAEWAPRWDFSATVFKDKIWMTGGMDLSQGMFNDVWYSDDGVSWKLANGNPPFSTRQGFITEYSGKLWIIGRLNDVTNKGVNDVWYSDDGVIWEKTTNDPLWTGREDFGAVIFQDKIWIFGGMDKNWQWTNDIWRSTLDTGIKK